MPTVRTFTGRALGFHGLGLITYHLASKREKVEEKANMEANPTIKRENGTIIPVIKHNMIHNTGKAATRSGAVVTVTGGSGFLGQHIVKLLHQKGTGIREIRIFDKEPFVNKLDYEPRKDMVSYAGDICRMEHIREAVQGSDLVIHSAGLVSFGTHPDLEAMHQVNVVGTANVIDACLEQNVSSLVYTSSADVVIGFEEILNGDESQPVPNKFMFPGYPETKHKAESLVLKANGRRLAKGDGSCLQTVSLRPTVMYGEGDPFHISGGLRDASKSNGVLTRVGNGSAKLQQTYVGNVAWAHLAAFTALWNNSKVGGHSFFITDDTPLMNIFDFMEPLLECRGFRLSTYYVPYMPLYGAVYLAERFCWFMSGLVKINLPIPSASILYINKDIYFSRRKAELFLDYSPLYTPQESFENSYNYYKNLDLDVEKK